MRARYYSPQLARFISRDPASLAGGVNLYAYAGDDPVDFSDPTGTDNLEGPGDVCSGCIGGFVGQPVFSGPSPLANQNGLDGGIVEFYDGSQNGGGEADADLLLVVFRAPIPYVPEDESNSSSPGQGWVRKGKGFWNQEKHKG